MPYAIKGNTVVKKDIGKVVGHSSNPKKYMRVLQAVEHGWTPPSKTAGHNCTTPVHEKFSNYAKY
jgi:hypothetical protein